MVQLHSLLGAVGVDLVVPAMILVTLFSCTSTLDVWALRHPTGAQYSATLKHKAKAEVRNTF